MPDPPHSPRRSAVSRRAFVGGVTLGAAAAVPSAGAGPEGPDPSAAPVPPIDSGAPFATGGVVPRLGVSAGLKGPRSESGIGAVMPWGGRLWFVSYTAHTART